MPVITGFEPREGPAGTAVVISGNNLTSVTDVAFTGADAQQFKIASENRMTVSVPDGAATGPIILRSGEDRVASDTNFTVTT